MCKKTFFLRGDVEMYERDSFVFTTIIPHAKSMSPHIKTNYPKHCRSITFQDNSSVGSSSKPLLGSCFFLLCFVHFS